MKTSVEHNAVVRTLEQVLKVYQASPSFLEEYLRTRLDDLAIAPAETDRGTTTHQQDSGASEQRKPKAEQQVTKENGEYERFRPGSMHPKWAKVLLFIGTKAKVHTNEVWDYVAQEKLDIRNKDGLRGQLATYVNKDYIKRHENGWFELKETGRDKASEVLA